MARVGEDASPCAALRDCVVRNNDVGRFGDPRLRPVARNVQLVQCTIGDCTLGPIIAEDVVLDGIKAPTKLGYELVGIACNRVVIRGDGFAFAVGDLLASAYPDLVIVAGKRNRNHKRQLDTIRALREMGVADPD